MCGRCGTWPTQTHPRLDVTLRACRYPHRVRAVEGAARAERSPCTQEPGPYVGAPAKEIRLAETPTVLKDERPEQAVRTIICREVVPGPKKDRWHPLYTTSLAATGGGAELFRTRQHHEQAYRVGVHDEFLDAVPCGYDKESPDPKRPRFQRGPLQMIGWLVALVYNAVADLAGALVRGLSRAAMCGRCGGCSSTVREVCIETPEALIVQVDRFRAARRRWMPVVDAFNAAGHRLPWLENRRVVVSLTPAARPRAGP